MLEVVGTSRIGAYIIGFLDLLAVSLVIPALPVYLKSLHISSTLSGVITSIYGALQLFSSPIVGRWGDKSGRLKVLSICLLISAAVYLGFAFLMQSLIWIAVSRVLAGIFKHSQDISRCVLLEDNKTERNEILGMFNAISSIGFIIGPSVHGNLVYHFGLENGLSISCVICSFIFLINFFITVILWLYFGMEDNHKPLKVTQNDSVNGTKFANIELDTDLMKTLKFSNFHKGVLASRFFLSLGVMMFRSSFVLWLIDSHPHLSSTTVGYILSFNGFLGLACGFLVGALSKLPIYKNNEEKMHYHASVLLILSFTLLLISNNIIFILFILTSLTLSTSVLRVCGVVLGVKYLPKHEIGRAHGLGSSVISVARFAAPIAVGLLQEISLSAPNHFVLLLTIIGTVLYCTCSYPQAQSLRKQKRE